MLAHEKSCQEALAGQAPLIMAASTASLAAQVLGMSQGTVSIGNQGSREGWGMGGYDRVRRREGGREGGVKVPLSVRNVCQRPLLGS